MKLYGLTEIAAATGIDRRVLAMWLHRGKLPEPDARLAMGPAWTARRIEPWIEAHMHHRTTRRDVDA
jgi:predicted DNA-binding transcriptional regulator AlpA